MIFLGMVAVNLLTLPALVWWLLRRSLRATSLRPRQLALIFSAGFLACFVVIFRKLWEGYLFMQGLSFWGEMALQFDNAFWEELGKLGALTAALLLVRRTIHTGSPEGPRDGESQGARPPSQGCAPALAIGFWAGLGYGVGEAILLSLAFLFPGIFQYTGLRTFGAFLAPEFIYDRFWAAQLHAVMGAIIALGMTWPWEGGYARKGSNLGRLVGYVFLAMLYHVAVDGTVTVARFFPAIVRFYPPSGLFVPMLAGAGYLYLGLIYWVASRRKERFKMRMSWVGLIPTGLIVGLFLVAGLVSGCSKPSARQALEIPWSGAETVKYVWKQAGQEVGKATFSVNPEGTGYKFVSETDFPGKLVSRDEVVVDADLRPLKTHKESKAAGQVTTVVAEYSGGKAKLQADTPKGRQSLSVDVPKDAYDNDSVLYVQRAMPLKEGFEASFSNVIVGSGTVVNFKTRVVTVEEVTVPAGTFKAYKVEMSVAGTKQYVWYGVDKPFYLVKYDNGNLVLEMVEKV